MLHVRPSHDELRSRVLEVFEYQTPHEPDWFIGLYPAEETDPEGTDMIARVDIGDLPIILCASRREMEELLSQGYNDYLFLVIHPRFESEEIRRKTLYFVERDRRIRKNFVLRRPLNRAR